MSMRHYANSGYVIPGSWENFKAIGGRLTPELWSVYREMRKEPEYRELSKEDMWAELVMETGMDCEYMEFKVGSTEFEAELVILTDSGDDLELDVKYNIIILILNSELFEEKPLFKTLTNMDVGFDFRSWVSFG